MAAGLRGGELDGDEGCELAEGRGWPTARVVERWRILYSRVARVYMGAVLATGSLRRGGWGQKSPVTAAIAGQ